jgi:multidrug efflux pump subunit AcrA (membrane-fusion protein)
MLQARRGENMRRLHPQKNRALQALLTGLCVLTLTACGFKDAEMQAENAATPGSENNPIPISTAVAKEQQVPLYIEATGSFVAEESSDLAPLTSGRVIATPVDIGDYVRKGAVIARLDDRDAALRLEQAKAAVEQADAAYRQAQAKIGFGGGSFEAEDVPEVQSAKAAYELALADVKMAEADARRYQNLVKTGDISQSAYERQLTQAETARARANTAAKQYETALNNARQNYQGIASAEAMLAAANAQLAQAQKAVDDTVILAPLSGYITERPIAVGEYVMPSSKIVNIVRAHPIRLRLQIPAVDAAGIVTGLKVLAQVESYVTREFEGRLTALNPSIDPNSRSLMAEAKFDNPQMELRPGMFAIARVILPDNEQAVMVPKEAVLVDPNLESIEAFVIEEGTARIRIVRIRETESDTVRILSGVSAGETVATSELRQLYDGAMIQAQ